jgi:hypothetical protein
MGGGQELGRGQVRPKSDSGKMMCGIRRAACDEDGSRQRHIQTETHTELRTYQGDGYPQPRPQPETTTYIQGEKRPEAVKRPRFHDRDHIAVQVSAH